MHRGQCGVTVIRKRITVFCEKNTQETSFISPKHSIKNENKILI